MCVVNSVVLFFAVTATMNNMGNTCVGPFYPLEANSRGVSERTLGLILGSFSISFILSAFICGVYLNQIGKPIVLRLGMICWIIELYGMGMLYYVDKDNKTLFVGLSVLSMLCAGTGSGF